MSDEKNDNGLGLELDINPGIKRRNPKAEKAAAERPVTNSELEHSLEELVKYVPVLMEHRKLLRKRAIACLKNIRATVALTRIAARCYQARNPEDQKVFDAFRATMANASRSGDVFELGTNINLNTKKGVESYVLEDGESLELTKAQRDWVVSQMEKVFPHPSIEEIKISKRTTGEKRSACEVAKSFRFAICGDRLENLMMSVLILKALAGPGKVDEILAKVKKLEDEQKAKKAAETGKPASEDEGEAPPPPEVEDDQPADADAAVSTS